MENTGNSEREESTTRPNLEQIFAEAEANLRSGLSTLSSWSDQARDILENRPGVVLASLSIAGFMTGLMVRGGRPLFERTGRKGFMADPLVVFLTGAFAGFTIGPRLLKEASTGFDLVPEEGRNATAAPSEPPASSSSRQNNVSEFERIADRFSH